MAYTKDIHYLFISTLPDVYYSVMNNVIIKLIKNALNVKGLLHLIRILHASNLFLY